MNPSRVGIDNIGNAGVHASAAFDNLVFVFVPFRIGKDGLSVSFEKSLKCCGDPSDAQQLGLWTNAAHGFKYFFSFLTDKVNNVHEGSSTRCVYLTLRDVVKQGGAERHVDEAATKANRKRQEERLGMKVGDGFRLLPQNGLSDKYIPFDFELAGIHLLLFGTGVGLCAFGITLDVKNEKELGEAEFLLKQAAEDFDRDNPSAFDWKVSVEIPGGKRETFLTLARQVVAESFGNGAEFSFHSGQPRANLLTWACSESAVQRPEDPEGLYYLFNGYSRGYMYDANGNGSEARTFGDPNVLWGVSNEVVCCYARPNLFPPAESFVRMSLRNKFRNEYLFMFIWLLHQKYALYAFLTDVAKQNLSSAKLADAKKIRAYKESFAVFESDYVYARITEVPEYQRLYDAIYERFALKAMYEDVRDPIRALEDLVAEEQKRHEKRVTTILAGLAVLSVFSAYVDSYEFIGKFFGGDLAGHSAAIQCGQVACCLVITLLLFAGIGYLCGSRFRGGKPMMERQVKQGADK